MSAAEIKNQTPQTPKQIPKAWGGYVNVRGRLVQVQIERTRDDKRQPVPAAQYDTFPF